MINQPVERGLSRAPLSPFAALGGTGLRPNDGMTAWGVAGNGVGNGGSRGSGAGSAM